MKLLMLFRPVWAASGVLYIGKFLWKLAQPWSNVYNMGQIKHILSVLRPSGTIKTWSVTAAKQ